MLDRFRRDQANQEQKHDVAKKDSAMQEEMKKNLLTGLGREIANIIFDKSYNKTKAENKINHVGIDNFTDKELSDDERKKIEIISKSEPGKEQKILLKLPDVNYTNLYDRIKRLINTEVVAELLERLKDPNDIDGGLDKELNTWVKQGFDIHKERNQFNKCFFCDNEIGQNLFYALSKHFSENYETLQNSIKYMIKDLKKERADSISENNYDLYQDLRELYTEKVKEFNKIISQQNEWLKHSEIWLNQKYINPFDPDIPEMIDSPSNYTELLNKIIDDINSIIATHNTRILEHDKEIANAKEKLELHSISIALKEQDYKKILTNLSEVTKKEQSEKEKLDKLLDEIKLLENKTSDVALAIMKINKHLEEFFGRREIVLEIDDDRKGYKIFRNEQLATNLSEGEKTAIAFSYFVVKTEENEFKINDGIIFIDDPISSLDTNFIYHCFSLITTHFKEVRQLFVSTHNFQLFNLVKEWFKNKNTKVRKYNEKAILENKTLKLIPCELYMVENFIESKKRNARLVLLDTTLAKFKSEYNFLFSRLMKFKEVELDYADFYTIGNIARRFFDIYADFKIPDSRDQKQKMETIVKEANFGKDEDEKISNAEWNKAYKLINEFSHNSEPTSTIEHKDKSESKDAIKILLRIIKESDSRHYEILEKNI